MAFVFITVRLLPKESNNIVMAFNLSTENKQKEGIAYITLYTAKVILYTVYSVNFEHTKHLAGTCLSCTILVL